MTFFVLRIAALPLFIVCWSTFLYQSCGMPQWARNLLLVTTAIPPFLNLYWFWKIYNKMRRMLSSPGRRDSKQEHLLAPNGKPDSATVSSRGTPAGKNSQASWLQTFCIRALTTVLGQKRSLRFAQWFFARQKTATPPKSEASNGHVADPGAGADSEWTLERVTALVRENVQKFCGDSCKDDTPLLEAGIDSSSPGLTLRG